MHQLRLNLFDDYSEDIFPYQHVYDYYDNYFFGYYESLGIYEPFYYFFQNRGYNPHTRRSRVVQMGRTHDSASVTTPKAYPVNFRVREASDIGDGYLRYIYDFDSSTGNYSDLAKCTMGEIVYFPTSALVYSWPSPPFPPASEDNPTKIDGSARYGTFTDTYKSSREKSFRLPFSSSSFTLIQYYRYKCSGVNHGQYVNIAGPIYITRSVSRNDDLTWRYTVSTSLSSVSGAINPLP